MLDEGFLPCPIALVLAVDLGDRDVGFIQHHEIVVAEEVEQRVRGLTGTPAVDRRGIVLDTAAEAELTDHLEVIGRPHAQPLGFEELPFGLEPGQALLELGFDPYHAGPEAIVAGDVVRRREHRELIQFADLLARHGVDHGDRLDLVAEELHPNRGLVVGRMDLDRVTAHPELAAHQVHVVAVVLHVDQPTQDGPLVVLVADSQIQQLVPVLIG